MVRITVSPAAFEAIVNTMPLGPVGFERDPDNKGDRLQRLLGDHQASWLTP